ncbi:penicillin-binding protein 2 [Marihabitans asiaticum]|uniref:Penicillin-binding protein 2 n=1 Tax=Marihabitans asiaticum TaxID=415218 RepID=A0A560W7T5_9MICO|nr:penicillin-binding protein 2 [Marihabitans asiaticum]TWD13703.1 penicillin-binding protein 2 [Marihabitans asiaticum]
MRGPHLHGRLLAIFAVFAVLLTTLVGRLGQLQLTDRAELAASAPVSSTKTVYRPAPRGRILDRHGTPLADNAVRVDVTLDRAALADLDDGGEGVIRRLAAALGTERTSLRDRMTLCGAPGAAPPPRCWAGSPYEPVTVAEGVDAEVALGLGERAERFPGVAVTTTAVRRDRDRPLAPQVLGYLTRAGEEDVQTSDGEIQAGAVVGRAGLEQQYDEQLRGTAGRAEVRVDARGIVIKTLSSQEAVPGEDVVTTLDADLQRATEDVLAGAVTDARARGLAADEAAAVVLDLRDGGVLASASLPTYDPSVWTGGISQAEYRRLTAEPESSPLTDRVVAASYPPASTFKVVSLPAAARSGVDLDEPVRCSSSVRIGDRTFRNFESRAYGTISWRKAIEVSCDTVFYEAAASIWDEAGGLSGDDADDVLVRSARAFGLGERTGIDLPGEVSGRVPDRGWKQAYWEETKDETCRRAREGYPEVSSRARADYLKEVAEESCERGHQFRPGDEVNLSIGQGDMLATPVQMAQVYGAIATGGEVRAPRIVSETRSPEGERTPIASGERTRVDLDEAVVDTLRPALEDVVRQGTAAGAFAGFDTDRWPVAGKTGTAEVFGEEDTAWFVSYAPADEPRYVVAVVIGEGGTGGGSAAGAAREIHEELRRLED